MFGWAKPVPIFIPEVLRNGGYKAAMYVSLAGIAYNFTVAFVCYVLFNLFFPSEIDSYVVYFIAYFLAQSIKYNLVLGLFNLYPLPPLDGSHALTYLAAHFGWHRVVAFYESIERYGMVILIVCIATPISHYFFAPMHFLLGFIF